MARPVILGNGSLTVGLNEQGLVNDFYYPYVGLDNLNTSRSMHHRIGVWVDGTFSWVDDGNWDCRVEMESDALVSRVVMKHAGLKLELNLVDFIDCDSNVFCRRISVINHNQGVRPVRLFMHQVFEISRDGRADTALFVPEQNYLLDYKGRCSLLIYGQTSSRAVFDQFSVGSFGIEGKEGTYKDAEDGELSNNPVEHGGVDSVLRLSAEVDSGQSARFDYWIVAADSQYTAEGLHRDILAAGLDARLAATRAFWRAWLKPAELKCGGLSDRYQVAVKKSLMVIKAHTDHRGGIIASCDSSIYNYGRDYYSYVWPRDGAYAMWPLIRLGYTEEPKRFFEFCRDIITRDGYLMHKYQPDRSIGSTWHPLLHGQHSELAIQEDETAILVYMLGEYMKYSRDQEFIQSLYGTFIQPAANFLARFIDAQTKLPHASYDLWEEKFLTTTYTASVVFAALKVAATFADAFEYPDDAVRWRAAARNVHEGRDVFFDTDRKMLRKGFLLQDGGSLQFDNALDVSSLFGALTFGLFAADDEAVTATLAACQNILLDKSPSGGAPRYENDGYFASTPPYLGNPWFVTTLWMGRMLATKDAAQQYKYIDWTLDHTLPSGVLSEQINPDNGAPVSVTPLVWSHGELINAILLANS